MRNVDTNADIITPALRRFAQWLIANRLEECADRIYAALSKRGLWPLPGFEQDAPREVWLPSALAQMRDVLQDLVAGDAGTMLLKSMARFEGYFRQEEAGDQPFPEEFLRISACRKEVLRDMLPDYTGDLSEALEVMRGIDELSDRSDFALAQRLLDHNRRRSANQRARLEYATGLYVQAQSIASIGNYGLDLATNRLEWSSQVWAIYELDATAQPDLETARAYASPRHRTLIDGQIARSIANMQPYSFHFEIHMPDGRVKTLLSRGAPEAGPDGKAARIVGTLQDVSDRVFIENRLRQAQRFAEKIAEVMPAIVCLLNPNTRRYDYINEYVRTISGFSADTVLAGGMDWVLDAVHPDDRAAAATQLQQLIEAANLPGYDDSTVSGFQYRIRHAQGHYVWLHTYYIVFDRDEEGRVSRLLSVSVDTTEANTQAEHLVANNATLAQSNTSLEQFAYMASHDLQEPLRKIGTFGEMLQQQTGLTPTGQNFLTRMVDASKRMRTMVDDVLAASQIAGEKHFRTENLELILQEVLRTVEDRLEKRNAVVEVPVPLPQATNVIASQIRRLFQNLLSNAAKFTRADAPLHLHISWERAQGSTLSVPGLTPDQQYLALRFADNGIGFGRQDAERIFTMFQRLNARHEYEGSGIGLAICHAIATHHGGAIRAHGEPGAGATFEVFLPQGE